MTKYAAFCFLFCSGIVCGILTARLPAKISMGAGRNLRSDGYTASRRGISAKIEAYTTIVYASLFLRLIFLKAVKHIVTDFFKIAQGLVYHGRIGKGSGVGSDDFFHFHDLMLLNDTNKHFGFPA